MDARSRDDATAFVTKDGSEIRVLLDADVASARNQSLAEAVVRVGQATERHYHARSEEIYYVLDGAGEMEVDGDVRTVAPGDAILIPPGAWHSIAASGDRSLRFLCCCAPAYSHDDTYFA